MILLAAAVSLPSSALAAAIADPPRVAILPYMRPINPDLLSRGDVAAMVKSASDRCEALGQSATVSVVDAEGCLRATVTSDSAKIVAIETLMTKIAGVLAFRVSSRDLQAPAADDPLFNAQFGKDARFLFYPGALPLFRHGQLIGAIAVGGAHDNDELCARAGSSAFTRGSNHS
jgi:uncharacterized protein GlcG (DUF336 family)